MVKKLKYLLFLIPFISILNVNATTLNAPSVYYYENDTAYSSSVSTDNWSNTNVYVGSYIGNFGSNFPNITRVDYNWFNLNVCSGKNVSISGSVHAIFGFFLNQSYSLSLYMNGQQLVCSTQIFDNGNALHYDCYGEVGGGTFSIYLTENSFTNNINYNTGVSQDVTYSCDVSNEAIVNQSITNTQNIINNNNSNTNSIIQNQDGNTQDIIDNQNQNAQDIIDNQNQNTQQQIESQKVCKNLDKNYLEIDNRYLNSNGNLSSNNNLGVSSYIPLTSNDTLKVLTRINVDGSYLCFYNTNKTQISCLAQSSFTDNQILTIPANTEYFRYSILKTNNRPIYNLCKNGNQALTDSITSDDAPNTSSELNDLDGAVASDTPISDLITLPITLVNVFNNGINSSCSPVNLGNLYGTNLVLPCINIEQRLGTDLWSKIDILFSIFMCYNIGMLFVSAFSGITSLRDDFDSIYQPKHVDTGYQPKHGG